MRDPSSLTLYIRSLSPSGLRIQQADVVRRMEELEANGTINEYSMEVWGNQLVVEDAGCSRTAHRIRDRIDTFREWAATHGRSLDPFFDTETIHSELTDETYTRVMFPTMTLVETVGDEIVFISPCTDDEVHITVSERLDTLESRASTPLEARS